MLRRSIVQLSSFQALRRIPRQVTTQIPSYLSSRKELSTASPQNASPKPGPTGKPPQSGSSMSKVIIGGIVVGTAVVAAYQTGYLDQILDKEQPKIPEVANIGLDKNDAKDVQHVGQKIVLPSNEEPGKLSSNVEHAEQKVEAHSHLPHVEALRESQGENQSQVQEKLDATPQQSTISGQEEKISEDSHSSVASDDQSTDTGISSQGNLNVGSQEAHTSTELKEEVQNAPLYTQDSASHEGNKMKETTTPQQTPEDREEDVLSKGIKQPGSLLDTYHLRDKAGESTVTSSNREDANEYNYLPKGNEVVAGAIEDLDDVISKDGKLVLDFLQVIHAAEKRQAELDAHVFSEEKRALKAKYEKDLKDAIARELMNAEEAAILDKELKRERAKAAIAIKSLQEKAEDKLKMELEQKENEAEMKLTKVQELAKAELAAAIAAEKAAQIERMAEANLHINALCMAFYARSEEARQSHSVHKLALGVLALEDALSRGLPTQGEIETLRTSLEGIDKDSVLDLVLSSLPEEARKQGTDTPLQLNQQFDTLKGLLRHFSLIPPGGGGIMAHSLAHVATWLKVKEVDQSGDGIESVINRVQSYLAEGKLAEAADALEEGVKGSQATELAGNWARQARNRAIAEQALTLLQAYATSISLT